MSLPVLSAETVAAELGVSTQTVREWVRKGQIPGKRIGRQWVVATDLWRKDLEREVLQQRREAAERERARLGLPVGGQVDSEDSAAGPGQAKLPEGFHRVHKKRRRRKAPPLHVIEGGLR